MFVCVTPPEKSFKPRHQGHLIVFSKESEISAGHQSPHFLVLLSSGHWFRHQDSHWLRKHWGQSSSISSVAVTIFGKCQSLLWIRVPNFVSKLCFQTLNPARKPIVIVQLHQKVVTASCGLNHFLCFRSEAKPIHVADHRLFTFISITSRQWHSVHFVTPKPTTYQKIKLGKSRAESVWDSDSGDHSAIAFWGLFAAVVLTRQLKKLSQLAWRFKTDVVSKSCLTWSWGDQFWDRLCPKKKS